MTNEMRIEGTGCVELSAAEAANVSGGFWGWLAAIATVVVVADTAIERLLVNARGFALDCEIQKQQALRVAKGQLRLGD